jgi:hypothetical protein
VELLLPCRERRKTPSFTARCCGFLRLPLWDDDKFGGSNTYSYDGSAMAAVAQVSGVSTAANFSITLNYDAGKDQ